MTGGGVASDADFELAPAEATFSPAGRWCVSVVVGWHASTSSVGEAFRLVRAPCGGLRLTSSLLAGGASSVQVMHQCIDQGWHVDVTSSNAAHGLRCPPLPRAEFMRSTLLMNLTARRQHTWSPTKRLLTR
jgi:hypothetical protein